MNNANSKVTWFLVLGATNPNTILCTDGQFHAKSLVGPGGYRAKVYKTEAGAKRSYPENPIQPYAE